MSSTTICGPRVPAHGAASARSPAPRRDEEEVGVACARYAHGAPSVIDVIVTCATCTSLCAAASPTRRRAGARLERAYAASFEVAKRSHTRP